MKKISLLSLLVLLSHLVFSQSIGVGAKPPRGAKMYLDGSAKMLHSNWTYWNGPRLSTSLPIHWPVVPNPTGKGTAVSSHDPAGNGGKYGAADIVTKKEFRDFRAHVEFLIQNPGGNSGVYLQNRYEIQVLDGDSTAHGMAAVINEKRSAYFPYHGLGKWNAYDIVFRAARFSNGKMVVKPRVTILFNGVKVQANQEINQVWGGPNSGIDGGNDNGKGITDRPGGLKLQAEGHDVLYRNIWIQELQLNEPNTDILTPNLPLVEAVPYPARLLRIPYKSKLDQTDREYFLYLPKGYDGVVSKKFPVMMFLHGNGERGNGKDELDYVLIHGPLYEAWIQKRDLPFIIISPQMHMLGEDKKGISYIDNRQRASIPQRLAEGVPPRNWGDPQSGPILTPPAADSFPVFETTKSNGWDKVETDLTDMLDQVLKDYQADKSRVYLTGLSLGGFATWYLASRHPDYFAAIAPVVGWGHPDLMEPIAKAQIPVWAFAGGMDPVVQKKYFYAGINKLRALGCPEVRFSIEEDLGHDTWRRVYGGEDLYAWLLTKHKN